MKCVALDSGCLTCAPTGALPPGVPCTDHSDCDDGLFCLDGVCRAYCLAGAAASQPGSCGAGFGCVQPSPASDLGACLPCGECTGTGTDQCPAGQSCQSIAGCQVCARAFPHDQPAGAACQYNGDCQSHQCLDNACRNGCPPTSTSMCAATEICAQIQPAPSPLDLCLPCGECDVLAGSGCKAGFKCVAYGPSCSVCLVAGAHGEGTPCSALADCARYLTCANGVCRAYCDLDDPGSTCIDECVGAPTSLPPNVGQCLHCGECKPWAPDSCNSPALKCNNYGSCVVCEGAGGSGTEGQTCRSPGDCGRNYGCIGGRCRSYCNLNAQPGQAGTCMLPRTCQVVDANLQMRVGAGACL
jgi:hypothetical protein